MTSLTKRKVSMDPIWNQIHLGGWGKYPSESLVRFLCRYKKTENDFQKKNKILDLGCGGGANTKMMSEEGFDVYAVDGAREAIRRAKIFVGSKKVKFASADFLNIGNVFKENYFDLICDNVSIYSNTLTHIEIILNNISKIIKQNGLFYSSCFSTKTLGYGFGKKLESGTFTDITKGAFKGRGINTFFYRKGSIKNLWKVFLYRIS